MKKTIESRREALEREVFPLKKLEEWKDFDRLWYISDEGEILESEFVTTTIAWKRVKNFLGIFHTKAEAEARLEAVKNFIKNL